LPEKPRALESEAVRGFSSGHLRSFPSNKTALHNFAKSLSIAKSQDLIGEIPLHVNPSVVADCAR
jgi:hypothetical protein